MRIELEKRAGVSRLFTLLSPLLALVLTLLVGAVMFAMLGKNPLDALYAFFVEPLLEVWSLHELAMVSRSVIAPITGISARRGNSPSVRLPDPSCRCFIPTGTRRSSCH